MNAGGIGAGHIDPAEFYLSILTTEIVLETN